MRLFSICIFILWSCEGPPRPEMLPVPEEKKNSVRTSPRGIKFRKSTG